MFWLRVVRKRHRYLADQEMTLHESLSEAHRFVF